MMKILLNRHRCGRHSQLVATASCRPSPACIRRVFRPFHTKSHHRYFTKSKAVDIEAVDNGNDEDEEDWEEDVVDGITESDEVSPSHEMTATDDLLIPDPDVFRIIDNDITVNSELAAELRAHFDQVYKNPLKATPERFVFDYWHVSRQYTLMRTPANEFFPSEIYDKLEDALIEFGERELGCRGISPVWLSYYVDGCRQELHTDAPHGTWAFVYSLTTDWDSRTFTGGETMILNPNVLNYWKDFDPSKGLETPQLMTEIEPRFGRLTIFDPRYPHGVKLVEGVRDPRKARVVLHGWFVTTPGCYFNGALGEEDVVEVLDEVLGDMYSDLGNLAPAVGTATTRISVGPDGKVEDMVLLTNTVQVRPGGGEDGDVEFARLELMGCISDHLATSEWPTSSGMTYITIPVIFE